MAEVVGADHAGLVDDHQVEMAEFEGTVLQAVQGFGDGVSGVAGAFAHRNVDGLPGRRKNQNLPVAAARHGGQWRDPTQNYPAGHYPPHREG